MNECKLVGSAQKPIAYVIFSCVCSGEDAGFFSDLNYFCSSLLYFRNEFFIQIFLIIYNLSDSLSIHSTMVDIRVLGRRMVTPNYYIFYL